MTVKLNDVVFPNRLMADNKWIPRLMTFNPHVH